ncbi:MAG: glucose 1-dehydrogenase [Anaerolineae bacterium]|nr:glucose 1-dehydrogenase [Anaerolineae bacterium]
MRLRGKVAIITGAGNGIGRATAWLFAQEGARVVVADRDMDAARDCVAAIQAASGVAHAVETDVSQDTSVADLVETTLDLYGAIDILMNNAGVSIGGSVVATEPERWARTLDVNLSSAYRTCRAVIPQMIQQGGGSIINIVSLQGLYGYPHFAAYAASKAGLIGLTRQIAVEYRDQNIRCNAISPGGVIVANKPARTQRLEPQFAHNPSGSPSPTPSADTARRTSPTASRLRQFGRPEDIAYAALFLASDEAAHISGHNLVVDGGESASVSEHA